MILGASRRAISRFVRAANDGFETYSGLHTVVVSFRLLNFFLGAKNTKNKNNENTIQVQQAEPSGWFFRETAVQTGWGLDARTFQISTVCAPSDQPHVFAPMKYYPDLVSPSFD